jgi:short-subunit dehydrogenase
MQPAVVVTGASSGLGVEFAKLAAAEGAKVVLIARSRPELELVAAKIDPSGRSAVVLSLDLGTPDAGEVIARELDALDLYCHILINNAGFGLFGEAVELDRERQLGIIDVNLRAVTDLMLRFLPAMVARKSGADTGVTVTCLCPGPVRTPFLSLAGSDGVGLFKLLRKLDAVDVARAGWKAMKAGRTLCVPGVGTKIAVIGTRLLPRAALLAIVGGLQRKR